MHEEVRMNRRYVAICAVLILGHLSCAPPLEEEADLVLVNGKVFTADEDRPWAEAVAVDGDRIIAIGSSDEIAATVGETTRRIDLEGRTVIPGINDAHSHFSVLGPEVHHLALPSMDPTWAETAAAMEEAAASLPPETVIHGVVGARIATDPAVDRAALDAVAGDHAVMLAAFYGHGLIASSLALELLGVEDEEPDPAGGFFEREKGSSRVNGRIFEYAEWGLLRELAESVPEEHFVDRVRSASERMLRQGVTSTLVMPLVSAQRYVRALAAADVRQRVRVVRMPMTSVEGRNVDQDRDIEVPSSLGERVEASGVKWVLEGTPLERGILLRQPFSDAPAELGQMNFSPEEIAAMLRESVAADDQILLHVSGDRTIEIVFDAMEAMSDVDWPRRRVRLEHGDGLTGDLLGRSVDLGVVVVQNPTHFAMRDVMSERFGPDRGFFRMRSLVEAGIPVAIGSDGSPSPWVDVMLAIVHPADPSETITVEQAIGAYTREAAFAEFREEEKGTLTPGMLADIAVLSQDVFSVAPDALPATESVLTIIGGEIVYDGR
jgi:predicted amidohydrolase YtcJ